MIKTLSVIAIFSSVSAFAMPAVGDHAVFNLTYVANGATQTGTATLDLTAFDGTNYTETQTVTMGGQTGQPQSTQVASSQLITDAQITQVLGNCAGAGGTEASVTTTGGTFDTCQISQTEQDGTQVVANIGKVTFGIVKQVQTNTDGSVVTLEINSFKSGS